MAQRGRKFEPSAADRRAVADMTAAGETIETICRALDLSERTLRKHFRRELAVGKGRLIAEATGIVRQSMQSTDERVALDAAKYVLARKGGWSEKHALEHSGGIDVQGAREKLLTMIQRQEQQPSALPAAQPDDEEGDDEWQTIGPEGG